MGSTSGRGKQAQASKQAGSLAPDGWFEFPIRRDALSPTAVGDYGFAPMYELSAEGVVSKTTAGDPGPEFPQPTELSPS